MKGLKVIKYTLPFFMLLIGNNTLAQVYPELEKAMKNTEVATVVIYRTPQLYAAAQNWAIFEGGNKICKLSNKKYLIYQREPGDSDFRAKIGGVQTWPKKVTGLENTVGSRRDLLHQNKC